MIIIFGLRRLRKLMGPIRLRCNNCGASPLALFRISTWFALFLIPLLPLSFKHFTACPNCKRLEGIARADVERARTLEASGAARGDRGAPVQAATLEQVVDEWAASESALPLHDPAIAPPSASSGIPPAAGWYADPAGTGRQRYWDGAQWTASTAPASS